MFKVGDIITGKPYNGYSVTTDEALMIVMDVGIDEIHTKVLYHTDCCYLYDENYVEPSEFVLCTFTEFEEKYPNCHKCAAKDIEYFLKTYIKPTRPETEPYVLSDEMRKELLTEMKELLIKYHYHPTDEGLNKILDEWCKEKADLIRLFEKHPNYNGKFQIVFDHDYDRTIDRNAICRFAQWLYNDEVQNVFRKEVKLGAFTYNELRKICTRLWSMYCIFDNNNVFEVNGKTSKEYYDEYNHFYKLKRKYEYDNNIYIDDYSYNAYDRAIYKLSEKIGEIYYMLTHTAYIDQLVNKRAENRFAEHFPEAKIREGQRLSRAINKVLSELGINKLPNYNKEFAKFADAINPLTITRHTVLSIHPVDFYTMSFGNSWASCHTIDKKNDRDIDLDHGYRGCNSSGTESYMLDATSCIFYTVSADYNGNQLELQDKINRNMFHYDDNRLVQGRVYPQSNDEGANDLYKAIREIVHKVFADMLDVPNYWDNKKGYDECMDAIYSEGTHYRDYENFDNCNVSILKDSGDTHRSIIVGHNPICPCCGNTHQITENIECNHCNSDY